MIKTMCFPLAAAVLLAPGGISNAKPRADEGRRIDVTAQSADPFASPDAYVVPFTFNIVDHPLITVQVSVNGSKPYPFVVDTAADCSLAVFDWAKDEFKLELTGQEFRINPGNTRARFAKGCNIDFTEQIGAHLPVHFDEPVVFSFPYVSEAYRPRAAGIIGAQVFEVLSSRFDFDRSRLMLLTTQHPRIEVAPSAQRLPLITEIHKRLVSVELDTNVIEPTTFRIDTGCRTTLIPGNIHLRPTPLSEAFARFDDLSGSATVRNILLDSMMVGSASVALPVLDVNPKAKTALLGVDILSHFNVTMDPQHGDLILDPRTHPDKRRQGDIGFSTHAVTGRLIVERVNDIVAERSGIRAGDEIVSVDGDLSATVTRDGVSMSELEWRANGKEGAVAKVIVLRDGKEMMFDVLRVGFPNTVPQTLGINLLKHAGKSARVLEVEPGTPADAAGIKPDDEITAVNGKPISELTALKLTIDVLDVHGKPTVSRLQVKRKSDGKIIDMRVEDGKLVPIS